MAKLSWTLLVAIALWGCGDDGRAGAPPPEPVPAPSVVAEESPEVVAEPEVDPLEPAPSPPDVDSMSDADLESACFRGRQEACDRLGH